MFFFQAEDGIRYLIVTGVQTCALPICMTASPRVHPSGDAVILAAVDRAEAHAVPWTQEDRLRCFRIIEPERRAPEHPETAGALDRVDAALDPADADPSRRNPHARRVETRDLQPVRHPGHVREARREPDEVDEVLRHAVEPHQLRRPYA